MPQIPSELKVDFIEEEAENVRNELWKKKEFKDAFILTIDEALEE